MNKTLKIAIKYALYYAPHPLRERLRRIQMERELREGLERAKRTKVSKAEFTELMDRLDWDSDIFLHTSMMNVGKIEGGAKFIADTISRKTFSMSERITNTRRSAPAAVASSIAKSSIAFCEPPNFAACLSPPKRLPIPAAIAIRVFFISILCV